MEFLKDISIDLYPKIIIAASGFFVLLMKIRDSLSGYKKKQELKLDLELYDLSQKNELENTELKESIEQRLKQLKLPNEDGLISFFMGLAVFIGFALWSVDIYQSSPGFNGWIILTMIFSSIGFTMLLGRNENKNPRVIFLKVLFYDKTNFMFGLVITLVSGILTAVLVLQLESFSFWQFLTGLFFIIGFMSLLKNIKIEKNGG